MAYDPTFADLARAWRGDRFKQSEAATALGIDQSTLNKIESGERGASVRILDSMRTVYGLSNADVAQGVAALRVLLDKREAPKSGDPVEPTDPPAAEA